LLLFLRFSDAFRLFFSGNFRLAYGNLAGQLVYNLILLNNFFPRLY